MSRFVIELDRIGRDRKDRPALRASVRELIGAGEAETVVAAGTMTEGGPDDLLALLRIMIEDSEAMQGRRTPYGCAVAWPDPGPSREAADVAAVPF